MKLSTTILLVTLVLLRTSLSASNISWKKEYDKADKSGLCREYDKAFVFAIYGF